LRGERRRLLVLAAAQVDALFEIDRTIARHAECGVTRRNAFHADGSVLVTIGTCAAGRAGFLIPQRYAILHPERRRIDGVVVLHRLAVVTEIEITGPTLVERDIAAMDRPRYRESDCAGNSPHHQKVIAAQQDFANYRNFRTSSAWSKCV